ncbi:MAG: hypothetical protein HYX74_02315, partial [Acidobacteria bacterium]|nr:hypothetical protein [Acidobacteriota bacterium]
MTESEVTPVAPRAPKSTGLPAFALLFPLSVAACGHSENQAKPFHLLEATIQDIHSAYQSGQLTARQLVQMYLDRIEAYDKKGPALN